jgi:hypothetical protein
MFCNDVRCVMEVLGHECNPRSVALVHQFVKSELEGG